MRTDDERSADGQGISRVHLIPYMLTTHNARRRDLSQMPKRKAQQTEYKRDRRMPTTRYEPDYRQGLTSQQVQEHRLHDWTYRAVGPPSKTTKEIVQENEFTYFILFYVL